MSLWLGSMIRVLIMSSNANTCLQFDNQHACQRLFGAGGAHLSALEQAAGVRITTRGGDVTISGPGHQVKQACRAMEELYGLVKSGYETSDQDLVLAYGHITRGEDDLAGIFSDHIHLGAPGRSVSPKSCGQRQYVTAMRSSDIVFSIGPAGTGKTYLAMAMAISLVNAQRFQRIILTRPAVEAGERLGFLPGDLVEKVNPYLRPLYDALNDMLGVDRTQRLMDKGVIEVAPLAFMRGRTLNRAFVILDEAQNTTSDQMKMFLTRLGHDAKAVVTGDVTQTDLPSGQSSGLQEATRILAGIKGISFCCLDERDVVRHPLVACIIKAYERDGPSPA